VPHPLLVPASPLLPQNIPLALAIMVVGSMLFASAATVQHLAVGREVDTSTENRHMGVRQVIGLLTNLRWLSGLAMAGLGAGLHIVALMLAPVTVVQPVGILAVPWSVLLAAKIHHFRPTRAMWTAVAVTIVGIVGFTLISTYNAAPDTQLSPQGVVVGSVVVLVIGAGLGLLGRFGARAARCLMWASAGSFFYGLSSGLVKVLSHVVTVPRFWEQSLLWIVAGLLVVCYLGGGWMIQQAYANGPAEIVVGSMTTTDPIVAVTFGLVVLGEGARVGWLDGFGMVAAGAVAVGGVIALSRYHPDAMPAGAAAGVREPAPDPVEH
jgi:drug/metabolite transporter (DMT)-like permease